MENLIKDLFLKLENKTLSAVESITGGYFSTLITSIEGASKYFKGSIIAYDNEIKKEFLEINIDSGVLNNYSVEALAKNINKKFKSDVSIAFVGNAGPTSQENKKIGVSFIGICIDDECKSFKYSSEEKTREKIMMDTAAFGVLKLLEELK